MPIHRRNFLARSIVAATAPEPAIALPKLSKSFDVKGAKIQDDTVVCVPQGMSTFSYAGSV